MKAIKTETTNRIYVAEGCEDLPATLIQFTDGTVGVESCLELSPEDVEEILKTGRIYITFEGQQIIPFWVGVKSSIETPVQDQS